MSARISCVTLGVRDLDVSTRFYESVWQLECQRRSGVVYFALEGCWLALYPFDELSKYAGQPSAPTAGVGIHLAQNVENEAQVDAVLGRARDAGAAVLRAPKRLDWGGYGGHFTDPDGFVWEIVFNPAPPWEQVGEMG